MNRLTNCSVSVWPPASKKNKDGQTREQDYSSESHYRIVSPTFQYKMSHQRVGKCIIINNKNFDEKTGTAFYFQHSMSLTLFFVRFFAGFVARVLSNVSWQGWMYGTAPTETLVSCSNVSRASASTSSSTTIRRVRRWSVFWETVSVKIWPQRFGLPGVIVVLVFVLFLALDQCSNVKLV